MAIFLLIKKEPLIKKVLLGLRITFFKRSRFILNVFLVGIVAVAAFPVYANLRLTDAELDTKYLDTPINPSYVTQRNFEKVSQTVTNQTAAFNTVPSADALDVNPLLLTGIIQNIRFSGVSEFLGIPAGVSNTGIPLGFGSESYSSKWSGNLAQMYSPVVVPQTIDGTRQIFNTLGVDVEIIPVKNLSPVQIQVIVNQKGLF